MHSLPLRRIGRCLRDGDLPSGDELGAEFERFLAQHAEDPRDGFKDDDET